MSNCSTLSFQKQALLILTSLNLLDYLDRYLLAALGSLVKEEFALSDKAFGFLGTAFFLVYLLASPVFGYLGDRYGRLNLMAGGAVLWSLATSATFWVTSYPLLVVTRGLVGVGEASYGTLAPAYLADILPFAGRSRAMGIFYLAIPLGSALAYLTGGFIGGHWGWRHAFLLGGLPGLVLAAIIYNMPGRRGWNEGLEVGGLSGEVRRTKDVTANENSRRSAGDFGALWQIPTLRHVTLGYGMITFTLGGLAFWMPRYLEAAKGLSLAQANYLLFGAVTLAGGAGTVIGGYLGSRLLTVTPRAPLWVSGIGALLSLPLGALAIFAPWPGLYVPGLAGAIFLLFLNPGALTAIIVSVAGPARRAQAVALNIIIIHLIGDVPSPFLIGWTSDLWGLQAGVSLTLLALAVGGTFLLSGLPHLVCDLTRAERPL